MHRAKKEPENQHHTAVAGPPAARGDTQVALTAKYYEMIHMVGLHVLAGAQYSHNRSCVGES